MAFFSLSNVAFKGLACAVPSQKISNREYAFHSAKENEQFIQTTGIEYRRVSLPNTTASDLCLEPAQKLLEKLNWQKEEITVLIFLSQTPDYKIPCTATILQHKLGLSKSCLAFDVNLGCSGYVYGLSIIGSLLKLTRGKGLLLVGDVSSSCVNEKDKTTAPLFSDAGSATALQYEENASEMYFNLQSDGSGYDAIIMNDGGSRSPINDNSFVLDEATQRRPVDMLLDGIKVFNFSRKEVAPNVEALLQHYSIDHHSVDYYLFHQANLFMNESIRNKMKIPAEKVPYSIKDYGNTSSASIPVTMVHVLKDVIQKNKLRLLLSGFGVGLSWGSGYLEVDSPVVLPMIEI
jgi:3-oxoacyl-[acyl-carrier-protein] synthase III